MRLKYSGLYISYAALAYVILVMIYGVIVGPMSVTRYATLGFGLAILGALIQLATSTAGRLVRLAKQ